MTLRIIAAEEQLRTLKLSVQTLSKFGHETVLEARPGCIHLRSVNPSNSAYVRMTFDSSFFDVYELFEQPVLSASLLSKSLVASLKTSRICRAIFEVFTQTNKMVVYIDCENGLQKRFEFDLIDADALQAQINFDLYPVRITVEAGELSRLLVSFQQSLEEVTIIANPDSGGVGGGTQVDGAQVDKSCQIHSFYDPHKIDVEGNLNSLLHTQLSLNAHQHFLEYQHTGMETADVTFNLKDFKVVLGYCASTRNNLSISFSRAGEPLAILPVPVNEHMNVGFSAEFILATMMDSLVDENGQHVSVLNRTVPAPSQQPCGRAAASTLPGNGAMDHPMGRASSPAERNSVPSMSAMNTHDAANHLVALNDNGSVHQQQPSTSSGIHATSRSKRPRAASSMDTEMTLTVTYNNNLADGADGDDEEDEEVPGTPQAERRVETCIRNWT